MTKYSREQVLESFRSSLRKSSLNGIKLTEDDVDKKIKAIDATTRNCYVCNADAKGIGMFIPYNSQEFGGQKGKIR